VNGPSQGEADRYRVLAGVVVGDHQQGSPPGNVLIATHPEVVKGGYGLEDGITYPEEFHFPPPLWKEMKPWRQLFGMPGLNPPDASIIRPLRTPYMAAPAWIGNLS
jgi:hypothetical protein